MSSRQGSPIRDFGLSFGVSAAIIGAALVFLSGRYPDVVWPAELGAALAVVGLAAVAGALLSGLVLGRTALVAEVIGAVAASSLTYAAIAGVAYWQSTEPIREAERTAAQWPVLLSQDYSAARSAPVPYRSTFGTGSVAVGAGQLVVSVDASRDFTYLVAPGVPQPRVGDFLLSADVTYRQGPEDGWCVAIFAFTASEHWFGMKVGPDRYEMTRDTGGLPHHPLDGPKPIERLHQDEVTRISLLRHGGTVQAFVDRHRVGNLELEVPDGLLWIGAQAANSPDLVRCAFDNVVVRGVRR